MTENVSETTTISKLFDQLTGTAFPQAQIAISELPDIDNDRFVPVVWPDQDAAQGIIWQNSTQLAWALRLADHLAQTGNPTQQRSAQEMTHAIIDSLQDKPRYRDYVLYQLLTDSYENEQDTINTSQSEGIDLKYAPLSPELMVSAQTMVTNTANRLTAPEGTEADRAMLDALVDRTNDFHATYLGDSAWNLILQQVKPLFPDHIDLQAIFTKLKVHPA